MRLIKIPRLLLCASVFALMTQSFVPDATAAPAPAKDNTKAENTPPSGADDNTQTAQKEDKDEDEEDQEDKAGADPNPEDLAEIEPAAGPLAVLGGSNLLIAGGGAAAAGGIAAAAGGGGGGSDSGSQPASNPTPPAPAPAPVPAPPPPPDNTTPPPPLPPGGSTLGGLNEVEASFTLPFVNADIAHGRGYTGDGIKLAIADTGLFVQHLEFRNRDNPVQCFKASTGQSGCENVDVDAHATIVAGIAAGNRNDIGTFGVAYEADLLNADIFTENQGDERVSSATNAQQAAAFNWMIDQGAQVINNSYGTVETHVQFSAPAIQTYSDQTLIGQAYRNAVDNDAILVWSTGNSEQAEPSLLAALPVYYPELEDLWVAVTAVSTNSGAIASYANHCGQASDFCIAAPGGDIDDGGVIAPVNTFLTYGVAAGTSMAAPHVSGGLAVLLEAFGPGTPSNLSPEQIVDLMFATANKNGIYADSSIYGQGLLDLDAATRADAPTLVFPTSSSFASGLQPIQNTNVNFGPAFGNAATLAFDGLSAGATDQYGRIFSLNLSDFVTVADARMDSGQIMANWNAPQLQSADIFRGASLQFAFGQDMNDTVGERNNLLQEQAGPNGQIDRMSFQADVNEYADIAVHYGFNPGSKFGLNASGEFDETVMTANEQSFNPYLDFAGQDGISMGFGLDVTEEIAVRSLSFTSFAPDTNPLFGEDNTYDRAMGSALELVYQAADNLSLSALSGSMVEDERVLGMDSAGGFDMQNGTTTFFAGIGVNYQLSETIKLLGGWQTGWTDAAAINDSLFDDFSTIRTDSFTVGIAGESGFQADDSWGFAIHQPMRVTNAQATLSLPVARSDNGDALLNTQTVNLTPDGRELNFQGFYAFDIDDSQDFSAAAVYRLEPGHNQNADPESLALLRYRLKF